MHACAASSGAAAAAQCLMHLFPKTPLPLSHAFCFPRPHTHRLLRQDPAPRISEQYVLPSRHSVPPVHELTTI